MKGLPSVPCEIHQRDDGLFEVVNGNVTAGPFPTLSFAAAIAEGRVAEQTRSPKLRRFVVVREVLHIGRT